MTCTSKQQELANRSKACTRHLHLLCPRTSCRYEASLEHLVHLTTCLLHTESSAAMEGDGTRIKHCQRWREPGSWNRRNCNGLYGHYAGMKCITPLKTYWPRPQVPLFHYGSRALNNDAPFISMLKDLSTGIHKLRSGCCPVEFGQAASVLMACIIINW